MHRLLLASLAALTACFGSLSPDRTPTGVDVPLPPGPLPPPAVPLPPPSPAVAWFTVGGPASVRLGSSAQLQVILRDSTGVAVDAPYQVSFFSQNQSVASVSTQGLVTGLKLGAANIVVVVAGVGRHQDKVLQVVE